MTVDELKARRKELSAKKKALELDGSDAIALCMVKEELLDVNAKLRALTPGKRIGRRPGKSHSEFSADRQQFLNWAQGEQEDESDVDARSVMRAAVAEGKDLMSERQWEMFKLWSDGLTMEKISDRLGVDSSTVSRNLHRAKKTLQEIVRCREVAGAPLSTSSVLTLDMSQPDRGAGRVPVSVLWRVLVGTGNIHADYPRPLCCQPCTAPRFSGHWPFVWCGSSLPAEYAGAG